MNLDSHIGKTWITRIHSLMKRGDQFLSRTGEKLPMNLTQTPKRDQSSPQRPIAMMTIGHRVQLHLHLVHHHRCPLRIHQNQKIREENDQKPLGQMKSLALPFHRNPTPEAVFSEVRDHGIICDQGSVPRFLKRVRHDSLRLCPQKDPVRN